MDDAKREISTTTSGRPPEPGYENAAAPAPINPATGQHRAYWVLSEEERAKGFVRPVRSTYIHAGRRVCGKPYETERPLDAGGVVWICIDKPNHAGECTRGKQATQPQLDRFARTGFLGGCGTTTSMGRALAETYARDPKYYGATFCVECRGHFPVGEHGEFVWFGTDEKVGT